jgi:hypothetical protein
LLLPFQEVLVKKNIKINSNMKQQIQHYFRTHSAKELLLNGAFILLVIALFYRLATSLIFAFGYTSWQISEFLINYQGGFVRRGLIGEILLFFARNFNINVEWTVKVICLVAFTLVCLFFVKSFIKKGYSLYILPLCFFLGAPVCMDYWIRKDCLMLCFLILILWIFNRSNISNLLKVFVINILFVFILLSHEIFAFFALPALFVLFWWKFQDKGAIKSFLLSATTLLPSIVVFVALLHYHGDINTAQAIWDSWNNPSMTVEHWNAAAVSAIGWSKQWAFHFHFFAGFLSCQDGLFNGFVLGITVLTVYYIASNALFVFRKNSSVFTDTDKKNLSAILIFQLICLLPVFTLLFFDYTRLFFYWTASSFALFLSIPTQTVSGIIPDFFGKFIDKINNRLCSILKPAKAVFVLLMMFIGISPYSLIISEIVKTTMIYNVLWILSKPLIIVKNILSFAYSIDIIIN